ncbi:sensor histidine kinase NtrY-like [Alkalilacustris brevis]|uniref:sensor histidine kinase NtrY-like n=1 Tax=Alkalilacustris brevis TaxID=2026338 RepID=UPI000E0D815B|nr:PAS domain-containing sensor histidine kinase [Alkalilacustris brevis]
MGGGTRLQRVSTSATWNKLVRLRRRRRVQNFATLGLVLLGPALVLATFLAVGPLNQELDSTTLRLILLADMVYVLVVAALIIARVARMVAARREKSAGSQLHLRLTGVFGLVALVPTVSVAVFAGMTINIGLEGWFSDRVRQVVGNSLAAAQAYEAEHERDLIEDAEVLAEYINVAQQAVFFLSDGELRQILTQGQTQIQRGLREAFVIDGSGEIRARGERSYLFDFERPGEEDLARALAGETVVIKDWTNDEFRALVPLEAFADRLLYVSRNVDGAILNLLDETRETIVLYQQLERERGRILFEFSLLYLGFALILILAAIWLGLWFAERLSRPVGRLAGAAERVGQGDLDVQVLEDRGNDEFATLGRVFNQMTRQLKRQRETLLENNRQIEARRRLFDSVLSSVSPGVIGLDDTGRVDFVNRSAETLLQIDPARAIGHPLGEAVPEFAAPFDALRDSGRSHAQEELRISRGGRLETLLVRLATRRSDGGALEGYVVAFDDVTDLVSAQRLAAWGDVARRIAHEIKNPLTPIQLAAERIKRKFRPLVGDEAEALDSHADVIIRQTNDLRRIVDEFSRFARMPEPDRRSQDIVRLVRDAVLLQEAGLPDVKITADLPDESLVLEIDATMLSQAFTNLIKNSGEAIESLVKSGIPEGYSPEIRVALEHDEASVRITICDNGIGLPEDSARLFEPYVTTRDEGTGLGLPIVKKIIEEHGGTLRLGDAPVFGGAARPGAQAEIRLPLLTEAASNLKRVR